MALYKTNVPIPLIRSSYQRNKMSQPLQSQFLISRFKKIRKTFELHIFCYYSVNHNRDATVLRSFESNLHFFEKLIDMDDEKLLLTLHPSVKFVFKAESSVVPLLTKRDLKTVFLLMS